MKRHNIPHAICAALGMAVSLSVLSPTAQAAGSAEALAQKGGCLACHKVYGKLVGPAYKDVAAKYKGKAEALTELTKKVRQGGKGVWGSVPMPPQTTLSDDELKQVLTWILSL